MFISLRTSMIFSAFALLFSGFVVACPQMTSTMGLDIWNHFAVDQELELQVQQRAELESLGDRVSQRLSLKTLIAQELIDGRISLAQAAEEFEELNRVSPEIASMTRVIYPAKNDTESSALQVLGFVNATLIKVPTPDHSVVLRLQREMEEMRSSGFIILH